MCHLPTVLYILKPVKKIIIIKWPESTNSLQKLKHVCLSVDVAPGSLWCVCVHRPTNECAVLHLSFIYEVFLVTVKCVQRNVWLFSIENTVFGAGGGGQWGGLLLLSHVLLGAISFLQALNCSCRILGPRTFLAGLRHRLASLLCLVLTQTKPGGQGGGLIL